MISHEDRIFNAAVKLFAHKDITIDRAVKDAIHLWSKVMDVTESDRMHEYKDGESFSDQYEDECDCGCGECSKKYDALADESVDDLPTSELLSRGFMNVAELDKKYVSRDPAQLDIERTHPF